MTDPARVAAQCLGDERVGLLEPAGLHQDLADVVEQQAALDTLLTEPGLGITIDEALLPIRPEVNGACEILGIDPLYVANEGKLVAVVAPEAEEDALASLRSHPLGADAVAVAEVRAEPPGLVLLETSFGGSRVVDMLAGDPLPRIC